MAIAIVIVLLVVVSVLFHLLSPWWFTPLASNWGAIDTTVNITFWVTGFVFVAINLFMAYAIIRYRHKKGSRAHYEPENKKLEIWLIGFTSLGVIAMLGPGLFVWANFVTVPDDAYEVEAVGQQWRWSYRFPGEDGEFGPIDVKHISVENPFGLNPDDPRGQDDILVSSHELRLPVDKSVKLLLRSKDVLHNFTVPQFRVKMDLVPGMLTYMWLTPTETGKFDLLCEEYCGLAHYAMRGNVVVEEQPDFENWLAEQPTFAETKAYTKADPEAGQSLYAVCAACHGPQGAGNRQLNAPKLSGQDEWYMVQQLKLFKEGIRGTHEDDIYGKQMAPMVMTLPDETAIRNVAAYIATLPDEPAAATMSGDIKRGKRLYATCGNCHGREGEGIWSVNAPRLAGINDWYLATQLKNFREGIRGAHPDDGIGRQMALVSGMLRGEQSIEDVIAYINTLQ